LMWSVGSLIFFATLFFVVVIYTYLKFFRGRLMEYGRLANLHSTSMVQAVNEGMSGFKELRILGREKRFFNTLRDEANGYASSRVKSSIISIAPRYLLELLLVLSVVILVVVVDFLGRDLGDTVPVLSMLAVASLRLFPSLNQIVNGISRIRYSHNTVETLYNDLKNLTKFSDQTDLCATGLVGEFKSLELESVSFAYAGSNPIISNLSIKVNAGDVIGFIGETGSGKTTLINIILGLIKPTKGEVLVNGKREGHSSKRLQGQVAYLPQKVFLIDDTLRNNIALGEDLDEIDMDRLNLSIESARLSKVVKGLPHGINTNIGESGVKLSGGQQQRIALARAFYFSRSILVMDESTSALDQETEGEIIDEIERNKKESTIIIITHRPTTLKHCDKVYKLEQGSITECKKFGKPAS